MRATAKWPGVAVFQWVVAEEWKVGESGFKVSADIGQILESNGAGVYQVLVWGSINGQTAVIADYPIFHEVPVPEGYSK